MAVYDGYHKMFGLFIVFDVKKWWFGVTFSFCDGLRKSVKTIVLCILQSISQKFGRSKIPAKWYFLLLKIFLPYKNGLYKPFMKIFSD